MINQPNQKLLILISPLMIVYLLVLALIDRLFYPQPTLSLLFYFIMLSDAFLVLIITRFFMIQRFLGKFTIPTIICLLVIVPMIATFFSSISMDPSVRLSPNIGPEMETLRLVPLSFTALILVAWLYRIRHVFMFCFVVTLTQSTLLLLTNFKEKSPISP